jgi:hypothetical protein
MWSDLRTDVADRILASRRFFRAACRRVGSTHTTQARTTAKGLMFVQLYSIYEFTVTSVVRAAIDEMKRRPTPINTIRLELLGIALHPELSAVTDCSVRKMWRTRIELFRRVECPDIINIPDDTFPNDGSHFRPQQIETIWELFGITAPIVPHSYLIGRITEMVGHRNEIAHGRTTADEIGRRFSVRDISKRISDTKKICLYLIKTMELHCSNAANLSR